ncbi:thiopurine S-methyltransferase [Gammaproteobacteria bacterium MFB021]|nr:thiopurine S-methyltransferase [Gammaproteobacteria bacterium MFB021]
MEHRFWQQRWEQAQLGFHLSFVHPILKRHLARYALAPGARVFLPLCGKTLDIGWLLSEGYAVVGAELSELAVAQLFAELGVEPTVSEWEGGQCWQHGALSVYQGDIFALTPAALGAIDLVYDRAALVALPPPMRDAYASQLLALSGAAPQLLITFEYDPAEKEGPPFPVLPAEVARHYADTHEFAELSRKDVLDAALSFRDAGVSRFVEVAWQLLPRAQGPT